MAPTYPCRAPSQVIHPHLRKGGGGAFCHTAASPTRTTAKYLAATVISHHFMPRVGASHGCTAVPPPAPVIPGAGPATRFRAAFCVCFMLLFLQREEGQGLSLPTPKTRGGKGQTRFARTTSRGLVVHIAIAAALPHALDIANVSSTNQDGVIPHTPSCKTPTWTLRSPSTFRKEARSVRSPVSKHECVPSLRLRRHMSHVVSGIPTRATTACGIIKR